MPAQVRRLYQDLSLGYHQTAPPRSLDPEGGTGFIWRDALNWISRDGVLNHRPALQSYTGTAVPYQLLTGAGNDQEFPVVVLVRSTVVAGDTELRTTIVVTTRSIWVQPSNVAAWVNCTPTYTIGTITATNGSATITGAGTTWLARSIAVGQLVTIDGTTYTISAVNSDTDITLTSNFLGATAAGKAYTIIRTFGHGSVNLKIYAAVLGSTLYVAGEQCAGAARSAVIKVSNIFTSPTSTYITGFDDYILGLDVISSMTTIRGIKALQDGRVVVVGAGSEVFYSSHLNDAVWTVSPGGQTSVVLSRGNIRCMGGIGNVTTLHDDEGVVLAYPTGLSDPPFRYQRSLASIGVHHSRTLRELDGAEYGVSVSGSIIRFDLNQSTIVSNAIKPTLEAINLSQDSGINFGFVDRAWGEYTVAMPDLTGFVLSWTLQTQTGHWWPSRYHALFTAMADAPVLIATSGPRSVVGAASLDGTTERALLWFHNPVAIADQLFTSGQTTITFRFTTEDLDFGLVDHYKCAHRLVLWGFRTDSGTVTITVSVSRDEGANWTSVAPQNWLNTTGAESSLQFSFDPITPGAGQCLRFRVEVVTNNFVVYFRRMLIVALDSGAIEQVEL